MWKSNGGWKSLSAVVVGVLVLLSICAYRFQGQYAYFDDFTFVVDGSIPDIRNWLAIGRPGTYLYLQAVQSWFDGDLLIARVFGGILVGVCTIATYLAMVKRGHTAVAATAVALAIPASTPIQLAVIWVNTASTMVAVLLAILSYAVGVSSVRRFAVASALMVLSALVYQPSACFVFVLLMMDWLLLPRGKPRLADVIPFLPAGIGLAGSFATSKIAAAMFVVDRNWTGRGSLLHDIPKKWDVLTSEIWPVAGNPVFPHGVEFGLLPFFLLAAAVVALSVSRVQRGSGLSPAAYAWSVLVAVAYFIAAGLPVIIVQENWPSYRTLVPWSVLALALVGIVSARLWDVVRLPLANHVAAAILVVSVGAVNAVSIGKYLVKPEIAAMNDFVAQVKAGVELGHRDFGLVLAPGGPFAWQFRTFELGWVSTSADWPPAGMLVFAEQRLGLSKRSLRYEYVGREQKACNCYQLDMRPYWTSLFERYTRDHWRKLEQEAWERKVRQEREKPEVRDL